ncbi:acyl-CoA carboxylase subunit epsilon [Streptomyces bambusae]|uniref:acyl-CoA carboxylase subunit epsilon n=1 Tax=Streptomyces bambusae TaxID=1550616 RepID=UPI001CFF5A65|nr:acyl-CoA carboxylase subunit epsilon [Streptomyces bambusae]MCB5170203.1 acyl-CoA carboxylase subunit epsilon [Streptomyces bambusae]
MSRDPAQDALVLKVVKGQPTAEEIAALTTVLLARAAALAAAGPGLQERTATAGWHRGDLVRPRPDPRGWPSSGSRAA